MSNRKPNQTLSGRNVSRVRKGFRPQQPSQASGHGGRGTSPDPTPSGSRGFSQDGSIETAVEVFADSPPGTVGEPSVDTAVEVFADSPQPGASRQTVTGSASRELAVDSRQHGGGSRQTVEASSSRLSRLSVQPVDSVAASARVASRGNSVDGGPDAQAARSDPQLRESTLVPAARASRQTAGPAASTEAGPGPGPRGPPSLAASATSAHLAATASRSPMASLTGSMAAPSITSALSHTSRVSALSDPRPRSGSGLSGSGRLLADAAATRGDAAPPSEVGAEAEDAASGQALTFLEPGEYERSTRASTTTAASRASVRSGGAGDTAAAGAWPGLLHGKAGPSGPPHNAKVKSTPPNTRLGMGDYIRSKTQDKPPLALLGASRAPAPDRWGKSPATPTTPKCDEVADDIVRVQDGRAVVQRPESLPAADGRTELRRQKSAVFSMKRGPLVPMPAPFGLPGSPRLPSMMGLMERLDRILPRGLRRLLLELQNHADLGVMALYAATLERHQRLSSALQALESQGRAQAAKRERERRAAAASTRASQRSRWSKWRRGILLPFGVPVPKQRRSRPLPPLPPGRRPNVCSVERFLRDALEDGLGLGAGLPPPPSSEDAVLAPQLQYDSRWAGDACRILAAYITRAVRTLDLGIDRYKTGCVVRLIEKRNQGVCSHFSALWDSACDCYSSAVYETDTFLAHAVLALVYWD